MHTAAFIVLIFLFRLLSSNRQIDGFRMLLLEILHIINNQYQITATACTRHLPGMNLRQGRILIYKSLHTPLNHGWEHGNLRFERSLEGRCKRSKIPVENRIPAIIGSLGKILHLNLVDILAFNHRTARTTWLHRNHADVALYPRENILVIASLKLIRPETVVIMMAHQSRHTDTDGILGTADNTVAALRVVFETEHQFGKNLRIHIRQLHRPYLLNHVAG